MQQITFDDLYRWLRGYKPKCAKGSPERPCGASVYTPTRTLDPENLGREIYHTYCVKGHSLFFEVVGEINEDHS